MNFMLRQCGWKYLSNPERCWLLVSDLQLPGNCRWPNFAQICWDPALLQYLNPLYIPSVKDTEFILGIFIFQII